MIRVDHHRSSTTTTTNSNLKQNPADLLSWDDADFLSDAIVKPLSHPDDHPPLVDKKLEESTTTTDPVDDPDLDTDLIASTREDDRSSSLSPVPPTNPLAEEKEAPIEIPQREEEEEDEGEGGGNLEPRGEEPTTTAAGPSSSRQSTPLSELSPPPPDLDDDDDEEDDAEGAPDPPADAMDIPAEATNGVSPPPPSTTTTSVAPTSPPPVSVSSPSISTPSAADFSITSTSIGMMATNPAMHDPKVVSILELNVEMFK